MRLAARTLRARSGLERLASAYDCLLLRRESNRLVRARDRFCSEQYDEPRLFRTFVQH